MTRSPLADAFTDTAVLFLRSALEHSPKDPGPIADGLVGWWTGEGYYVCARCAGRLIARGVALPRPAEAVWTGDVRGVCVTCPDVTGGR